MKYLCLDYVNSTWYIKHKLFADPLNDSKWLIELSESWNIKELPAPTEAEIMELIQLRNQFTRLLLKISKRIKLDNTEIELVNHYMNKTEFSRQFQNENGLYKLALVPKLRNWSWFMAEVAVSFSNLCSSGALNRLKICQNPECGWFFIDESKSGNRKWCDDTCSSLMKVRRFRAKAKLKKME